MANYRMLKQEADDYTKAMGRYVADVDDYNARAEAFNSLPYVSSTYVKPSSETSYAVLSNGATLVQPSSEKSYAVLSNGETIDRGSLSRGDRVSGGVRATPPPPLSSAEPKELTFTRAEASAIQNPPQSLASASAQTPSSIDRLKEATGAKWSPYQGGLDTSRGILSKVMSGKL